VESKRGEWGDLRRRGARGLIVGILSGTLALLFFAVPAMAEAPPTLWTRCDGPPPTLPVADPACEIPRGIAADPDTGNIYVADQENARVVEFSVWGEFLRAWGWDVVASGPGDDTSPPTNEFEVCEPASGDTCKDGAFGGGAGQFGFSGPQGVARDPSGNVYVVDLSGRRVEKFTSEGEFLLTFGGDVNKTKVEEGAPAAARNRCPVDPGDVCQAGTEGAANGQFGAWKVGSYIAAGPDGTIYVGDVNRIQKFNGAGEYIGEIKFEGSGEVGALPKAGTVNALAADPVSGDLYFAYFSTGSNGAVDPEPFVLRIDPVTGEILCKLEVGKPRAVAVDPVGGVYVFDRGLFGGGAGNQISRVLQFDPELNPNCDPNPIDLETGYIGFGKDEFETIQGRQITGLAASNACGIEGFDIYVPNPEKNFIRAFGPQPDPLICPPPEVPPEIDAQYASSVDDESAVVQAIVNPHFWSGALGTTTYYLQYGTATCIDVQGWDAPCVTHQPQPPGSILAGGAVDVGVKTGEVFLEGLQPATAYRYRFVAEGSGALGVEIVGVGGKAGEEGKAAGFTTFPPQPEAKTECPNQAFRTGPSARLPDCRAFELVSPLDKDGADITSGGAEIDQAARNGDSLAYTVARAIGEAESAPLHSQYIARRDPATGWASEPIGAPREGPSFWMGEPPHNKYTYVGLDFPHYRAFSEDLCSGWNLEDTDPVLAPGAIPDYPNIYRRDNCSKPTTFETITTVKPPELVPAGYGPTILGFSAEGLHTVFEANGKLTDDTPLCVVEDEECTRRLFISTPGEGLRLVSVLPDGSVNEAPETQSPLGTATSFDAYIRADNTADAIAADGSRVYWSGRGGGAAPLYVRLNPEEEQSALIGGKGQIVNNQNKVLSLVAAEGKGTLSASSSTVTAVETTVGQFVVGQPITGTGIPAGTTIVEVSGSTLTLSAAATSSGTVTIKSSGPAPFAVGQPISGEGIPLGTTIVAVAAGQLTLSANATQTKSISLFGACREAEKACTLAVSSGNARFWDATPDGNRAIYTVGEVGGELREFDMATQSSQPIAGEAIAVMGTSEDLSHVYFASREVLEGGAQTGEPNLYLYQRDNGGSLTFIATLSERDVELDGFGLLSPVAIETRVRDSRVSPDGEVAAFTSVASLTGYDNADLHSGEPDTQVFVYDAGEDALRCVSCNPGGTRPVGTQVLNRGQGWVSSVVPPWMSSLYPSRALSDDGERLFFESIDALVLADTNGRQDVYEWERAESAAQCGPTGAGAELYVAAAGGCISLISGGQSKGDSDFIDASPDGRDVFIRTGSSLLAHDPGLLDIYDAREGGGFPPPEELLPPCEGEACQNPAPPPEETTPSSTVVGPSGNVTERPRPRCRKGKVRRRGRCVPRKRAKRAAKRAKRAAAKQRSGTTSYPSGGPGR
jgi:DNA-binding beta-propeller fold protein YncE